MIIANWKCNGSKSMIDEWFESYKSSVKNNGVAAGILGIAPPAIFINEVYNQIKKNNLNIGTISQDIAGYKRKFTGAMSANMLHENGECSFCIIGHSERRISYNEDDKIIQDKILECLSYDINPIFCIGETNEENKLGKTTEILENQLMILRNMPISDTLTIAYEPIWAIGTGNTPNPKDVNDIHKFIKDVVQSISSNSVIPIVIYGGSVNEDNAESFLMEKFIDGALVGGASLNGRKFANIVNTYNGISVK